MKNLAALTLILALAAGLASPAFAGGAAAGRGVAAGCHVDAEEAAIGVLPACAVLRQHGKLRVVQRHLAALAFNPYGLAPVCLQGIGGASSDTCWAYVNRRGWVIVRDVAVMDNGANEFHHGLVRVTRGGKWGLADTRGKLVVPLRYDGMLDHDPQHGWSSCTGCRAVQDQWGYHEFVGGQWLRLNARGKVIGPMQAPGAPAPQAKAHAASSGNGW
jgi:hypothetical protein